MKTTNQSKLANTLLLLGALTPILSACQANDPIASTIKNHIANDGQSIVERTLVLDSAINSNSAVEFATYGLQKFQEGILRESEQQYTLNQKTQLSRLEELKKYVAESEQGSKDVQLQIEGVNSNLARAKAKYEKSKMAIETQYERSIAKIKETPPTYFKHTMKIKNSRGNEDYVVLTRIGFDGLTHNGQWVVSNDTTIYKIRKTEYSGLKKWFYPL